MTFAQKIYIEDLIVNNRYNVMHNGNWTEWSAIWAEILCVISKSNERTIAPVQDLVSSNILLMQYWASLKLNSSIFWGEKRKFSKQWLQNLPHDTLCLSFSCNYIGYFKQALKSDWLFCFQCSLLIGWENDAI